jgi:hypothetical protein
VDGVARESRTSLRSVAHHAAGSLADAIVAPFLALGPRHRIAAATMRAAGLPVHGAYAVDVRRVRTLRRHRRLRHVLRRRGPSAVAVRWEGLERLRAAIRDGRGAILVSTHGGPRDALPAALLSAGVLPLQVRHAPPPSWMPPSRTVVFDPRGPASERARTLVVALRALRGGDVVRITFEGHGGTRAHQVDGAHVGRLPIPAGGGAAALARLSGAPAFPVVASVGILGRVRVAVGPAVEVATPPSRADDFDAEFKERMHDAIGRLVEHDPAARFERLRWAVRIGTWGRPRLRAGVDATPREEVVA